MKKKGFFRENETYLLPGIMDQGSGKVSIESNAKLIITVKKCQVAGGGEGHELMHK